MAAAGSSALTYVKSSMSIPFVASPDGSRVGVPRGPGLLDGGHDVRVGSATAEVAAHLFADLGVGVGVPFAEEPDAGADLPGGAVAALEGVVLDERLLQRVQPVSLGQAFDRRDLDAGVHDG